MADAVDMDKAPTEGHVLLSAHMKKRAINPNPLNKLTGAGMHKERLVVLRPKTITWYEEKGKDDRHPKGEIILNAHTLLEEYDTGSDDTYAFMIETGGTSDDDAKREKLVLQCATKEEREKWKKQIRGQVKMLTEQAS